MQFIFEDKGAASCLIRECPTCDWKKGEGRGGKEHRPWTKYGHAKLSLFCTYTNRGCSVFDLSILFLYTCPSYRFVSLRLFHNCYLKWYLFSPPALLANRWLSPTGKLSAVTHVLFFKLHAKWSHISAMCLTSFHKKSIVYYSLVCTKRVNIFMVRKK